MSDGRKNNSTMFGDRRDPHRYDDILYEKRPLSRKHRPMAIADRAAQFSPFAALTGYDDAVKEEARLTEARVELTEDERAAMDQTLRLMLDRIRQGKKALAVITWFRPDDRKEGGRYVESRGEILGIDRQERRIVLEPGLGMDSPGMDADGAGDLPAGIVRISIDDILRIEPETDSR